MKKEKADSSETASVEWLAGVAGLDPRRIQQLVKQGKVPEPLEHGKYARDASLRGMFAHYRALTSGVTTERLTDKARREKAQADLAEMEAGKVSGTLCLLSDYESDYADAIARGVANISRLESLSDSQKEDVFAAIRAVKLPELEEET